ncbi:hypothetical protein EAF04_001582 [Stromatinia cepivora]|nr:hypothetical protein EAF04_001582 [Stromatinia cepivora]
MVSSDGESSLTVALMSSDSNVNESGNEKVHVTYKRNYSAETLDISFRRTVRVPDNGNTYNLPPDCGLFPIYSVDKYKDKLPNSMVAKGGVFVPMHQREAMWINFESVHPFAIKVHVGGVNAISGEHSVESPATDLRRKVRLDSGKSIQDYVVTGSHGQLWLDGIAKLDGKVMQFVATSVGNAYSVEAQITGEDQVCGIQLEIIPSLHTRGKVGKIYVRMLTGRTFSFKTNTGMTVLGLKQKIAQIEDVSVENQRLIFDGRQMENGRTLAHYNMEPESCLHLVLSLKGGGGGQREPRARTAEMAIAPGGFIKQTIVKDFVPAANWDRDNTTIFNIQMLNAEVFESVVGVKPPPTPITAKTYADFGYPFYTMYEEQSGVGGNFPVKSVAQLDALNGEERSEDDDESIQFHEANEVTVVPAAEKCKFAPVEVLEDRIENLVITDRFWKWDHDVFHGGKWCHRGVRPR